MMNNKGHSIVEYAFLIVLVLGAMFVFRDYLSRGLNGRYKSIGDTYGMGRQYDPKRTVTCGYDDRLNMWYDEACFESETIRQNCQPGNSTCETAIINGTSCRRNSQICNDD